jgi:hypothetical protein
VLFTRCWKTFQSGYFYQAANIFLFAELFYMDEVLWQRKRRVRENMSGLSVVSVAKEIIGQVLV